MSGIGPSDVNMTLGEFRVALRRDILAELSTDAQVDISEDAAEYKRGALTVTVGEEHGLVIVTYVAAPTQAFGHSSGAGLPLRPTRENVEPAAREVHARLNDPFLHRSL